jgi:hypothetical protein
MSGPPWVSYVNCSAGATYKASGVTKHGDFQVWVHQGKLTMNDEVLENMGESFWVALGAHADLEIAGTAYIAGAKFELDPSLSEDEFTSAFIGPKFRSYSFADAVAKRRNANLHPDPHICNGSSPSMDFVFGSLRGHVDPPSVAVVNCAPSSTPEGNFVWSHFHPFGALYLPLSGEICFATKDVVCATPGVARWTSANLQYYEYFRKINETNSAADKVRDIAGVPAERCQYPNIFAVTNFDGLGGRPGVPNFDDWPVNAHDNHYALGIAPWGIFRKMTVQATKVVVKASVVEMEDLESSVPVPHLV